MTSKSATLNRWHFPKAIKNFIRPCNLNDGSAFCIAISNAGYGKADKGSLHPINAILIKLQVRIAISRENTAHNSANSIKS